MGLILHSLISSYNHSCRGPEEDLLAAAAHEEPGYRCEGYTGEEERCPHIGQKLIDRIQMGELESESESESESE